MKKKSIDSKNISKQNVIIITKYIYIIFVLINPFACCTSLSWAFVAESNVFLIYFYGRHTASGLFPKFVNTPDPQGVFERIAKADRCQDGRLVDTVLIVARSPGSENFDEHGTRSIIYVSVVAK